MTCNSPLERINRFTPTPWTGSAYRNTSLGRDPRSGTGARLFGGRWNPRGSFPTIYLAYPESTCLGELDRVADAAGTTTAALLAAGREFHDIDVHDLGVLDLREQTERERAGLTADDLGDDDWAACQPVGEAAHFLGFQGVLAPSATGHGLVLAVFETRLHPGQLTVTATRLLTPDLNARLRS